MNIKYDFEFGNDSGYMHGTDAALTRVVFAWEYL